MKQEWEIEDYADHIRTDCDFDPDLIRFRSGVFQSLRTSQVSGSEGFGRHTQPCSLGKVHFALRKEVQVRTSSRIRDIPGRFKRSRKDDVHELPTSASR